MEKQPLLDEPEQAAEPELSLTELQQNVRKAQQAYWKAWSKTTSGTWHKRIMLIVSTIVTAFFLLCLLAIIDDAWNDDYDYDDGWRYRGKVPLEIHIMSKCPDAQDCLRDMILPAMQNVSDKVDFKMSYIGRSTDTKAGVSCMHGPDECLGNMMELCAAKLYPDPKTYLGFTMCLTREYSDIPKRQLVEDCALEHRISMWDIDECLTADDGAMAVGMLQSSFNRSKDLGVTKSCTVRLNDEVRCIMDGGEWTNCEDGSSARSLVYDIMALSELAWEQW